MKVLLSTWGERGVTTDDIDRWIDLQLVVLQPGPNFLWTVKSPSSWPKAEKERYYATAGKQAKANGEAQKARNAASKAWWATIVAQYGEGVRQVSHRCNADTYATAFVNHDKAFNYTDGMPHFCEVYLEPEAPATDGEPYASEYTFCPQCDAEWGWTPKSEVGYCPTHGADCILPPNHRIRQEHKAWVAALQALHPNAKIAVITEEELKGIEGAPGPERLRRMFPLGRKA